jgi:hypothetical protein
MRAASLTSSCPLISSTPTLSRHRWSRQYRARCSHRAMSARCRQWPDVRHWPWCAGRISTWPSARRYCPPIRRHPPRRFSPPRWSATWMTSSGRCARPGWVFRPYAPTRRSGGMSSSQAWDDGREPALPLPHDRRSQTGYQDGAPAPLPDRE